MCKVYIRRAGKIEGREERWREVVREKNKGYRCGEGRDRGRRGRRWIEERVWGRGWEARGKDVGSGGGKGVSRDGS
jgi:hypothetical protein